MSVKILLTLVLYISRPGGHLCNLRILITFLVRLSSNRSNMSSTQFMGKTIASFNDPKTKYRVSKFIGEGGYGRVFQVKRLKDNKVFAMKVLSLQGNNHHGESKRDKFREECGFMMQLEHKHIMAIEDIADLTTYGCMILEHANEGNLETFGRRIPASADIRESVSQAVAFQMIDALAFLHSRTPAVIHRDIKPDNILVFSSSDGSGNTRYDFKLSDFGISSRVDDEEELKGCGDPKYKAPEFGANAGYHTRGYEDRADIYSLGVVLVQMLADTVQKPKRPHPIDRVSVRARPLIESMLASKPEDRPSASSCKRRVWVRGGEQMFDIDANKLGDKLSRLSL